MCSPSRQITDHLISSSQETKIQCVKTRFSSTFLNLIDSPISNMIKDFSDNNLSPNKRMKNKEKLEKELVAIKKKHGLLIQKI